MDDFWKKLITKFSKFYFISFLVVFLLVLILAIFGMFFLVKAI